MRYKAIPISKVRVPEVRVTAVYDEEHLKLLHDTLAAMGQRVPIVVVQVGEAYELVDGLHRLEEARAGGSTLIDAVISEGLPQDVLLQNLVLNQVRGKVRASDLVTVIQELTQKHGMDSEAIAAKTGFSRGYIERLWKIAEASPEVREALDANLIGVGQAFELSRLPRHIQQEEALHTLPIGRWTVKQTQEFVDGVLAEMQKAAVPGAPKPPPPPPRYECSTCHTETPPDRLSPVQLCPGCMGTLWEAQRPTPGPTNNPVPAAQEAPGA